MSAGGRTRRSKQTVDGEGKALVRRRIAGDSGDFTTVDHLALRGTNVEIGRALAEEARRTFSWQPVPASDPARNRARRRWFEQHWPQHFDRMCGAALACDLDVDDDRFDFGTLLAIPISPGCSAVWCSGRATEDGRTVLSRNMDFTTRTLSEFLGGQSIPGEPAMMSRPAVLEVHPEQGHAGLVTAIGDLSGGVDGINDSGLAVALLADDESTDLRPSGTPQAGLYEMHVLRYLLDTCASAAEAKEALYSAKQYDEFYVAHYLVADPDEAFVWERDAHNAEHVIPAAGDTLCVTNFLLHRTGADRVPMDKELDVGIGDAYRRARVLHEGLGDGRIEPRKLWDLLETVRADQARDELDPVRRNRTLWHNQFDLESRSVEYEFYLGDADFGPRRSSPVTVTL